MNTSSAAPDHGPGLLKAIDWRHVAVVSIAGLGPASGAALNTPLVAQYAGKGLVLAVVASVIALGAMIYVFRQFASRMSSSGGLYTWNAHAWGSNTGFVFGWTFVGAYFVLSACGFPVFGAVVSNFLREHFHLNVPWWVLSAAALVYVILLALRGVVSTLHAAFYLLAFEIVVVLALGTWALCNPADSSGYAAPLSPANLSGTATSSFGLAMTFAIFSYIGIEEGATLGSEVRDPRRDVRKGLLVAGIVVAAFFLFVSYSAVIGYGTDHVDAIASSQGPLQELAGKYWGSAGEAIFVLALGSSILAWSQTAFNAGARVLFTLGREQVLSSRLGRIGERRTPVVAIWVTAIVTLAIGVPVSFTVGAYEQYGYIGFLISVAFIVAYLVTCAGLISFARKNGELHWGRHVAAGAFGVIALGYPLYKTLVPWPTGVYAVLIVVYLAWMVLGTLVLLRLRRTNPAAIDRVGTAMALAEDGPESPAPAGVGHDE